MEILININMKEVMREVSKTSAYVGMKITAQDGGNLYGRVATIKEDTEMLNRYWEEACANLATASHDYLKCTKKIIDDSLIAWIMTLEMPYGYNMASNSMIYQYAFSYVVSYILMKWLLLCGLTENTELYVSTTASNLKSFADALRTRHYGTEGLRTGCNVFGGDEPQNVGAENVIIMRNT